MNSSSATAGRGSHGALGLLLFKRSIKSVDASVEVHLEKERAVYDAISIGENQDGRSGGIRGHFANDDLHGRSDLSDKNIFFGNRGGQTDPLGHFMQILAEIRQATLRGETSIQVSGQEYAD